VGGWRGTIGACFLLSGVLVGGVADARADEISVLEGRVEDRDARLDERLQDLNETGASLKRAQARVDEVGARAEELASQTGALEDELAQQQDAYADARKGYEARAVAVYKGTGDAGLLLILEGMLGTGEGLASSVGAQAAEVLLGGKEDLDAYADAREELANTKRQLSQKQEEYGAVRSEADARMRDLEDERDGLEASIGELRESRNQAEDRIEELEAAEKERIQRRRAATRVAATEEDEAAKRRAEQEAEVARDEIVVAPVDLPVEAYMKLYKKAASDYGFAGDWYVLAAVGQVESNHGQTMGPSTAGAMGPMQFLPSTWKYSGVDGNGDGEANIMDPRDAIPAAANYLRVGGAPDDWSAALYSYNHAEWYVDQVLAVAETYRQADEGSKTKPYV
jgi:peptidoglycan hydrolase CwlO-like protein